MRGLGFAVLSLLLANMAVASTAVVEFSDESLRIRYQQLVQGIALPQVSKPKSGGFQFSYL